MRLRKVIGIFIAGGSCLVVGSVACLLTGLCWLMRPFPESTNFIDYIGVSAVAVVGLIGSIFAGFRVYHILVPRGKEGLE